jgi:DNA adenine methylase
MSNIKLKPFIKYCGGKSKLLPYIIENLPQVKFKNYYEPFIGGGSVFFSIYSIYNNDITYTISDINNSLINCYDIIKSDVNKVINELRRDIYKNDMNSYYNRRKRYNELKYELSSDSDILIEKVALFIYLNKCGYNGMYRENLKGEFNIPFGRMKNPKICDEELLRAVSESLKNVHIGCCEYNNILDIIEKDDFVYLDPPYHETFTDYTNNKFGEDEQKKLKLFIDNLRDKGVYIMLSNSATSFIKDLYKDYKQINLMTKYSLGGKGADRGNKEELLIINY